MSILLSGGGGVCVCGGGGQVKLLLWNVIIQHITVHCSARIMNCKLWIMREKGRDLTQSYDKSPYTSKMSKGRSDNTNNATKKFDYRAVADRLRIVSWSNYGHPTGVVNLVKLKYRRTYLHVSLWSLRYVLIHGVVKPICTCSYTLFQTPVEYNSVSTDYSSLFGPNNEL